MKREDLAVMLGAQGSACGTAREALLAGGAFVVWEGTTPAGRLAHIYRARLRRTERRGQPTQGLAATVGILEEAGQEPLRIGRIDTADGTWSYMLFLDAAATAVLACTGVASGARPTSGAHPA
ncbi:hypothetical protein ADK86_15615 [Streptomyces sp. NRRL F-5755]|uniref:hypothetical protein n=1 Tax=Streptomyces sp. NRRL F-5755 TaxID=1519475 RepID=UPI0006AF18E0|nr:hypothetical protein [Streptomyces sp. NRRL F-5755]KOT99057.1 hypothetical protein ADK86_15615 [Streptomyces sp. NRRL F-5755]